MPPVRGQGPEDTLAAAKPYPPCGHPASESTRPLHEPQMPVNLMGDLELPAANRDCEPASRTGIWGSQRGPVFFGTGKA